MSNFCPDCGRLNAPGLIHTCSPEYAVSERREAVARAICSACGDDPDHMGDARGNTYRWQDYIDAADAAIAAMTGDEHA